MFSKTVALTGAFAVLASAVPMNKRDVVWVTQVDEAVVTVPVTTTVWVDPTDAPQHYGHNHGGHKQTTVQTTINVYPSAAPAPSSQDAPAAPSAPAPASDVAPASSAEPVSSAAPSPSSVYVAPSSAYVAPTTSTSAYVAPATPSSVYVAPTTSSSVYVAPASSEAPSSTSAAPASYSSSSSSSSGSGLSYGMAKSGTSYSGDFTYYDPTVGYGSCGDKSAATDHMVAMSYTIFDSYNAEANGNSNNNPICGKTITITGVDGSSYKATVLDRCPGCAEGALDLPEAFFNTTTNYANGRAHNMKWSFD